MESNIITTKDVCLAIQDGKDISRLFGAPGSAAAFRGHSKGFAFFTVSPAYVAARYGRLAALRLLREKLGDDVLAKNYHPPCCLASEAAAAGHRDVVKYLVDTLGLARAEQVPEERWHMTPFRAAVAHGESEIAAYLAGVIVAAGADGGDRYRSPDYDAAVAFLAARRDA